MSVNLDQIRIDPQGLTKLSKEEICELIGEIAVLDAKLRQRLSELINDGKKQSNSSFDSLLTVEEVAQRLSLKKQYVYRLIKNNELPTVHAGKYKRIDTADLQKWILQHKNTH